MWIVTKEEDHYLEHPVHSRDWDDKHPELALHPFRMRDGDGNIIYEGFSSAENFDPLDDYGQPNFGCSDIQYLNLKTNKWETL
jgi:hypothetical protein